MWELHARRFPDAPAAIHGGEVHTWREFNERANGIANTLLAAGVGHQDKVAQYMHNCPEYLESMFGLFKISLVPVNTNYRYTEDELTYLWDNSDAVAVIFHATYTDRCAAVRSRVPNVKTWIWVDDGSLPCPDWAVPYEAAATSNPAQPTPAWPRSGDDMYFLYTGGTTGMPKGVMWRQDDMVGSLDAPSRVPLPPQQDIAALEARVSKPGPVNMPAAPLMSRHRRDERDVGTGTRRRGCNHDQPYVRCKGTARGRAVGPREQYCDRGRRIRTSPSCAHSTSTPASTTSRR